MNFKILSKKSERILNECIRFNRKIEKIKLYKIIPISQYEKFIVDKYNIKTDEKLEDANLTIDELYNKKLWSKVFNSNPFPFDEEGNKVDKDKRDVYQEDYYWLLWFLHSSLENKYYGNISKKIFELDKTLKLNKIPDDERNKILSEERVRLFKHYCISPFKKLTIFEAFKKWWENFGGYLNIVFDWSGEDKDAKNSGLSLLTSDLCKKWQDFFKKAKLAKINFYVSTNMFYMSEILWRSKKEKINLQDLIVKISIQLEPHIFNELKDSNYIDDKQIIDKRLAGYIYDQKIYIWTSKITDKDIGEDSGFYFLNQINTYFKNKRIAFILPWLSVVLSVLAIIVSIASIIAMIYKK